MILRTVFACLFATTAFAGDRALLIGIDDYSALDGAPRLNGAVADVARMERVLTDRLGFAAEDVFSLTDSAAHHDAILSTLIDRLVGETGPGDRVVLYFAGLGTTLPDGSQALIAFDGDAVLGRIPVATFADILNVIADRDVTVILDTGFDGGPLNARGIAGAVAQGMPDVGEATLWSAASGGQFAWEDIDRGVFTHAFTEALSIGVDPDGDGRVTNAEILAHVSEAQQAWCDALPACLAAARGFTAHFSGDRAAMVIELVPMPDAPPRVDIVAPIELDDGAPASFRETVGFITDLFAPSNAAGLSLSVSGGDTIRIGDTVSFTALADRPGALLLLDVDPSGALTQVYPSRLSAEGVTRMSPGRTLSIPNGLSINGRPMVIRVSEPAGQGVLLALFIEGDLPELTEVMPAGLAGGPLPNGSQSLFEISQRLLRLEADPDRRIAWSATYLPYRIEH